MNWKKIATADLPAIGARVILFDANTNDMRIGAHMLDTEGQPPETYWDVEYDQQYAIYEKWTHYCLVEVPQ